MVDIPAGTITCEVTGSLHSFKETLALGSREGHCLQIEIDQYILCDPPFLFSNHSCEPNCGINSKLQLFTLVDIPKGKELFWDYSTSMYERHWTMHCRCGSINCRGLIEDFNLLSEDLQIMYLNQNIVLPFIVKQLAKEKKLLPTRA